jgi:hypothetical protein
MTSATPICHNIIIPEPEKDNATACWPRCVLVGEVRERLANPEKFLNRTIAGPIFCLQENLFTGLAQCSPQFQNCLLDALTFSFCFFLSFSLSATTRAGHEDTGHSTTRFPARGSEDSH